MAHRPEGGKGQNLEMRPAHGWKCGLTRLAESGYPCRMFRRPSPLLTGLALLALGWAQVFGLTRGYVCDCAGTLAVTAFDHCHGPHGETCHDHDEAELPHDHDDHGADEDTHEHTPLTESMQAKQLGQAACLGAPAPALIAVLEAFAPALPRLQVRALPVPPPRHDGERRWPRLLTHRIALRV